MFQAQQLSCQRNNVDLFSNLTFYLDPGQWLQVKGPNGSGKSSLLKSVLGLLPCQAGKIFWEKRELRFPDPIFLSQVHYLGHKMGIQGRLTPRENLKGWIKIQTAYTALNRSTSYSTLTSSKIHHLPAVIESALNHWGLLDVMDIPCEQLSQGQCQRLALARLQLSPAILWVLDEPCTALDNQGVECFETTMQQHLAKGGLAIVASHSPLTKVPLGQTVELAC